MELIFSNINNFDNGILLPIFASLPPKELAKAGMVCKKWHNVQATEELWERHCLEAPHGKGSVPYQESWKQRYIILNNYISFKPDFTIKKVKFGFFEMHKDQRFPIINGNHMEIRGYKTVTFRNVTTNEDVKVNLKKYIGKSRLVQAETSETRYTLLTSDNRIISFDILTGELVSNFKIDCDEIKNKNLKMFTDENRLIIYCPRLEKFYIYDINTGDFEKEIDVKYNDLSIHGSSSNYVVFGNNKEVFRLDFESGIIESVFVKPEKKSKFDKKRSSGVKKKSASAKNESSDVEEALGDKDGSSGTKKKDPLSDEELRNITEDGLKDLLVDLTDSILKRGITPVPVAVSENYVVVADRLALRVYENNEDLKLLKEIDCMSVGKMKIVNDWIFAQLFPHLEVIDINLGQPIFQTPTFIPSYYWFETDGNQLILSKTDDPYHPYMGQDYLSYDFRPKHSPVVLEDNSLETNDQEEIQSDLNGSSKNKLRTFGNNIRQFFSSKKKD